MKCTYIHTRITQIAYNRTYSYFTHIKLITKYHVHTCIVEWRRPGAAEDTWTDTEHVIKPFWSANIQHTHGINKASTSLTQHSGIYNIKASYKKCTHSFYFRARSNDFWASVSVIVNVAIFLAQILSASISLFFSLFSMEGWFMLFALFKCFSSCSLPIFFAFSLRMEKKCNTAKDNQN